MGTETNSRWTTRGSTLRAGALVGLLVAAAAVGGCSSAGPERTAAPAQAGPAVAGPAPAAQAAPSASGAPSGAAAPGAADGAIARQVISTATIGVEVPDPPAASAQAGRLALEVGGFVDSSDQASDGGHATIALRVPPPRYVPTLDALAAMGRTTARRTSAQDVTDEAVDLDARITAAKISAARIRELVAGSKSVADVLSSEAELAKRDADISAMEGRRRLMGSQLAFATINASFDKPVVVAAPPPPERAERTKVPSFFDGLSGGWSTLRVLVSVVLVVLGALLPFAVPAAVLTVTGRFSWQRWRRSHPAAEPPAPTVPGPPPPARPAGPLGPPSPR